MPHFSRRTFIAATAAWAGAAASAAPARAAPVAFDGSWEHLTFRRLDPNGFSQNGGSLGVVADGSSSILYKVLPESLRGATRARWKWSVTSSVPPSDLSQIGNDDRNLGVFFVSVDDASAGRIRPDAGMTRMMANRSARILMYTWGGGNPPGTVVPSPHAPARLRNLITRPAEPGSFTEEVDLTADFQRVFGEPLQNLVALAVSSNSENTPARVEAEVGALEVF